MENLSLIFQMRFIYGCKFNNVIANKITFTYTYRQFNYIVAEMSKKDLEKSSEIIWILNKEFGI